MSAVLSDDLRQALRDEGAPLRIVDPATGETYVLVPAAQFDQQPHTEPTNSPPIVSSARLLELAARHAPPAQWLDEPEEQLF
jgi:hypothetical protein